MEWMNRGGNAPQNNTQQTSAAPNATAHRPAAASRGKSASDDGGKLWRAATVFLLFAVTILMVAVISYLVILKPETANQGEHVNTSKYQAVFLNGGQVYFGKISETAPDYMKLDDIYYLRVNQQVQPNGQTTNGDVQLVKLGCELHGPENSMVINTEQIIFWENLKDDGQVTQAIAKYVKENPDGQKCQTASQQTNTNTDANKATDTNDTSGN